MGLLSNSQSFSCFYASPQDQGTDLYLWLKERVFQFSFRDEVEGLSKKVGWVSIVDPYSSEIAEESMFVGDFLVLSMRVEERRVPKALVKKYCAIEEEKIKRNKDLKRLSRREKKRIREQVEFLLLQKVLPIPSVYDMAWDLNGEIVYFFSTSSKVIGDFQDFFHKSFDIMPSPIIPYNLAMTRFGTDVVKGLSPEVFV